MFRRSTTASISSSKPLPRNPSTTEARRQEEEPQAESSASALPLDSTYQKEDEKSSLLLKRINVWEKLIESLLPWIKQVQKVELNTAKSYSKLTQLVQLQDDIFTTGDLTKTLDSLRDFSTSVMNYHELFSKYLKEQIQPKLESLQSDIKKEYKHLNKKIQKAASKLQKCEEEAMGAIQVHQKTCEEMEATPNLTSVDPWFTEYRVKGKLQVLVEEQNSYKKRMLEVADKIKTVDEHVARTIQEAFLQMAKWRAKQITPLKLDVDELINSLSRIVPETEFQQFSNKTGLAVHIENWKQPGGAHAIDYPFRGSDLSKIVRSGALQRQGKMMKSRWHTAHFILTQSAFLHCFDNFEVAQKDLDNPLFTIDLRQCAIQLTSDEQASSFCFEIAMGGKDRWILKAPSEEVMVDWMIALRKTKDDTQKKTNPPFSPNIVHQYSPHPTAQSVYLQSDSSATTPPVPAASEEEEALEPAGGTAEHDERTSEPSHTDENEDEDEDDDCNRDDG